MTTINDNGVLMAMIKSVIEFIELPVKVVAIANTISTNVISALRTDNCVISREGLFVVASTLGVISAALFTATLLMHHRLSKFIKVSFFNSFLYSNSK